jgi:hypothetical protein
MLSTNEKIYGRVKQFTYRTANVRDVFLRVPRDTVRALEDQLAEAAGSSVDKPHCLRGHSRRWGARLHQIQRLHRDIRRLSRRRTLVASTPIHPSINLRTIDEEGSNRHTGHSRSRRSSMPFHRHRSGDIIRTPAQYAPPAVHASPRCRTGCASWHRTARCGGLGEHLLQQA